MSVAVDSGLAFLGRALDLRGYRQQILAADIANASTPGFKAVDLDFRQALAAVAAPEPGPGSAAGPVWLVDDRRDLGTAAASPLGAETAVKYQAGTSVTLDGNSVDLNQEKVAAADNAVQYEAAATFASQTLRMLATAINGAGAASAGGA